MRSPRSVALAWTVAGQLLVALAGHVVWAGPVAGPETPEREPQGTIRLNARPALPAVPAPIPFLGVGATGYKIGLQDLLEITVFDVEELDQTVRVAGDGSITMPLLGRMVVAGLTKTELEQLIARLLGEHYIQDPQVTVFVKEYESKKVAVSGAVKSPGTYEMLGRKTLLEMISMAGGLDKDFGPAIIIFRPIEERTERISVNLERLIYDADPALNLTVASGDIIYVPTIEKVRIFVGGAVNEPNLYEVPRDEPVTVLKAITLAGGTTDRAAEKRIQIMRTDANGNRVALAVNLRKIKRGKAEDPILQKDDIVLVPESFF